MTGAWTAARGTHQAERWCMAALALAGIGSVLGAFGTIWLKLQDWPAFEAWVRRLGGL